VSVFFFESVLFSNLRTITALNPITHGDYNEFLIGAFFSVLVDQLVVWRSLGAFHLSARVTARGGETVHV
jgi:hypothetical protein